MIHLEIANANMPRPSSKFVTVVSLIMNTVIKALLLLYL